MANVNQQAKNSIDLYRGQNPASIRQGLRIQSPAVVKEIMSILKCSSQDELVSTLARM